MNVDQTLAVLNNVVDELVEKYCEPCKERDCDFCKVELDSDVLGISPTKCKYCRNRDKSGACSIICRLVQDDDYCSWFDKKGSENK